MLVLSRRKYETIRIGSCYITVTAIEGNQVKLGIEAPPNVPIVRVEVDDGRQHREEVSVTG